MIDWEKKFDKIYCINFNEFKTRHELMEFELNRVGILNSPNFEWFYTYNGPFQKLFVDLINGDGPIKTDMNTASCILGHADVIKKAYYNGYNKILIIEDDIRFLKSLDNIELILGQVPKDYDIILLDRYFLNYPSANKILRNPNTDINPFFKDLLTEEALSAGCYILNRKGMEMIISMLDMGLFYGIDILINRPQAKHYLKRAISTTALAIQATFTDSTTKMIDENNKTLSQKAMDFQRGYKCSGIVFDNYMMRKDGSRYKFGDYIEE